MANILTDKRLGGPCLYRRLIVSLADGPTPFTNRIALGMDLLLEFDDVNHNKSQTTCPNEPYPIQSESTTLYSVPIITIPSLTSTHDASGDPSMYHTVFFQMRYGSFIFGGSVGECISETPSRGSG